MKNRPLKMFLGVLAGMVVFAGLVAVLARALGNRATLYDGQSMLYWQSQLTGKEVSASNRAYTVVSEQAIPQLLGVMTNDFHDSSIRLTVARWLNRLPGVNINLFEAGARRASAVRALGDLGPVAASAVPALIQAAKGSDPFTRGGAMVALGSIHHDPATVIPLLRAALRDFDYSDEAATGLGGYGPAASAAVPEILPLLRSKDKDTRRAARFAIMKIDPSALPVTGPPTAPARGKPGN